MTWFYFAWSLYTLGAGLMFAIGRVEQQPSWFCWMVSLTWPIWAAAMLVGLLFGVE